MENPRKFTLILLFFTIFSCCLFAGSLKVGSKVIYPGGTNQPVQEKDAGVSFNAKIVGFAHEEPAMEERKPAEIFASESYETIIEMLKDKSDLESRAYLALALYYTNQDAQAKQMGQILIENSSLSDETREKLCDELELELPEAEGEN